MLKVTTMISCLLANFVSNLPSTNFWDASTNYLPLATCHLPNTDYGSQPKSLWKDNVITKNTTYYNTKSWITMAWIEKKEITAWPLLLTNNHGLKLTVT